MFSRFIFFVLVLLSHPSYSNSLAEALLQKAQSFQERYKAQKTNSLSILENDDLANLSPKDFEFLKSRLKIYGIAPFEVSGTKMIISLGAGKEKLEVDYQNIDLSALTIRGIQYPFDLSQDLQKLYEIDFKRAVKSFKLQNASLWQFALFPLTLSSCEEANGAATESAVNSNYLPMAYLKFCTECALMAADPSGIITGAAGALTTGIIAGVKEKSIKTCASEFCKNMPGLGGFIGVYNAHKKSRMKNLNTEHSK